MSKVSPYLEPSKRGRKSCMEYCRGRGIKRQVKLRQCVENCLKTIYNSKLNKCYFLVFSDKPKLWVSDAHKYDRFLARKIRDSLNAIWGRDYCQIAKVIDVMSHFATREGPEYMPPVNSLYPGEILGVRF